MQRPLQDQQVEVLPQSLLLPLIISQLKHYGYHAAAKYVADTTEISLSFEPSTRLAELTFIGQRTKDTLGEPSDQLLPSTDLSLTASSSNPADGSGVLDLDAAVKPEASKAAPDYTSWFTTLHRLGCRALAFAPDGRYIATGSQDTTLKILDTQRIVTQHNEASEERKVIRTLYDHTAAVNDIKFHPNGNILASGSDDCQIKLFDMNKMHVKRAFRYLADAYPIRSLCFHPSGDYLISGTDHHAVRIYDIHTMRCFIPSNPADHHSGGIIKVAYSPLGTNFATCSQDGSIKLYDTVSSRCINTIPNAHGGSPVTSVLFSKNSKYLLSAGMDSIGRLWDMTSGKVLVQYTGASLQTDKTDLIFTHNEEYVVGADDESSSLVLWDARTGALLTKLGGHTKQLLAIASSPVDAGVMTASNDFRARYWNIKALGS
ncbi:hypothetical protein BASA50_009024 [Batrachochytrium salamandrivorans]|uniref:Cleavage stimulation factor 50 kDa subunit n=1 Tax=Batrachochytrium salamandrivorans TaxID=1357716 RepID=A0ABQ8F341_9FUNG|nr:hypothetical protein BASA62_000088 [Batrachochytrium salamandrivorans]KAH6575843.1 hypothetical protein BASA60_004782 [Batrachochytrium salamandrivorans]KAH6578457.1 hypothetical protein BASA61_000215 [Batrachochytrium salamandrivorans]KAH6591023.1 hypothetical protein BASA50_009024 [Batrachochytrium salamandrivorans]KAH9268240.1 hypothetical protein BASA84_000304 [Batrachochytrium salamandrivorans]